MDISLINHEVDLSPGEWIDDIPNLDGVSFKVRSANYKPYQVATAGLGRRSGKKLATDEGLVEYGVKGGKPLAEHILLDWKGVISGGKPVKYTAEGALAVLTADDAHGVGDTYRTAVLWAATQVADRLAKAAKEAAGN